jgi:hypothetical protein
MRVGCQPTVKPLNPGFPDKPTFAIEQRWALMMRFHTTNDLIQFIKETQWYSRRFAANVETVAVCEKESLGNYVTAPYLLAALENVNGCHGKVGRTASHRSTGCTEQIELGGVQL